MFSDAMNGFDNSVAPMGGVVKAPVATMPVAAVSFTG